MTSFPKWSDVRADIVAAAGGEPRIAEARPRNQAHVASYSRWDRVAYIERVGGEDEAERRRKALMAREDDPKSR